MISGLCRWLSGKESACQRRRCWFNSWIRKISLSRKWQPASEFLPGKFHRQRSLAGYSSWGHKESDMIEHIHHTKEIFHKVEHIGHTQWSWVALACSRLKWGFSSSPETESTLQRWEHQILTTRPVASAKSLAIWLCRKEIPPETESSET